MGIIGIEKSEGEKDRQKFLDTLERSDKENIIKFLMDYYDESEITELSRLRILLGYRCRYSDYCL